MNTHAVLLGIIVVMAIIFYIFSSYSLYNTTVNDLQHERHKDRVRCPPKMPINTNKHPKPKSSKIVLNDQKPSLKISMYEDDMNINNKGFLNELIYRPPVGKTLVDYGENQITVPSIPLNDVCDTQNLPIGNIHISFLMDKTNNNDANLIL